MAAPPPQVGWMDYGCSLTSVSRFCAKSISMRFVRPSKAVPSTLSRPTEDADSRCRFTRSKRENCRAENTGMALPETFRDCGGGNS